MTSEVLQVSLKPNSPGATTQNFDNQSVGLLQEILILLAMTGTLSILT